jgi:hypothetical protein
MKLGRKYRDDSAQALKDVTIAPAVEQRFQLDERNAPGT